MGEKRDVLFCGSVGLESNEAVFRAIAGSVGSSAKRYPDGETGPRDHWILWQTRMFADHPDWEVGTTVDMEFGGMSLKGRPYFKLKDGLDPGAFEFGPLGYADEAIASYQVLKKLRDDGTVPAGTRLQVSIPTPAAVLIGNVIESQRALIEPAYESAMLREVDQIVAGIPHQDLAIQWDVCTEILATDGGPEPIYYDDILGGTVDRLQRLAAGIPDEAELGIHLCYGDPGHKHIVEPPDAGKSVLFSNAITERLKRVVNWIHLPVPRGRNDDAYFAPLADLKLRPETQLYLGLVHLRLGEEGTNALIARAERYVSDFGVATECGFGRRESATIPELLKLHAAIAA